MKNIKILLTISFLKNLYFYIPLLTIFLLSKNISLSAVVFSTTFYSVSTFLGEVPTGIFADRFGQKTSLIIGYILEAFGLLMLILFPTTLGLYIASCVQGFAGSFLSGSEEALLYESVQTTARDNYQKIYSKFLSNGQVGFMFATTLAGVAYQYWGQHIFSILMIITCTSIFSCAILSLFLTNYRPKIKTTSSDTKIFSIVRQSISLIRKNNTIFTLTIIAILTLAGEYFLFGVYQPYFEKNHVPAIWVGLTLSIGTLLNIVFTRYVYILEKHFSIQVILACFNITLGTAYILLAFMIHPVFLVGIYTFMNGIMNLQLPIISDYINSHTPTHIRATVLSGVSFTRRFFANFSYILLGVIVGAWGIPAALIFQGVYLLIGIAIGYYLLVRCGCVHKVRE